MKKYYIIAALYEKKGGQYFAEQDDTIVAPTAAEAKKIFKANAGKHFRVKIETCIVERA
jgi:hypothetical protein